MAFKAMKYFKADGKNFEPGHLCENAGSWPTLRALLESDFVKEIPDSEAGALTVPAPSAEEATTATGEAQDGSEGTNPTDDTQGTTEGNTEAATDGAQPTADQAATDSTPQVTEVKATTRSTRR